MKLLQHLPLCMAMSFLTTTFARAVNIHYQVWFDGWNFNSPPPFRDPESQPIPIMLEVWFEADEDANGLISNVRNAVGGFGPGGVAASFDIATDILTNKAEPPEILFWSEPMFSDGPNVLELTFQMGVGGGDAWYLMLGPYDGMHGPVTSWSVTKSTVPDSAPDLPMLGGLLGLAVIWRRLYGLR